MIEAHHEKQRAEAEFAGGAWTDQGLLVAIGAQLRPLVEILQEVAAGRSVLVYI